MFQIKKQPLSRPAFMKKLHYSLVERHLRGRLEVPILSTSLGSIIENVITVV